MRLSVRQFVRPSTCDVFLMTPNHHSADSVFLVRNAQVTLGRKTGVLGTLTTTKWTYFAFAPFYYFLNTPGAMSVSRPVPI